MKRLGIACGIWWGSAAAVGAQLSLDAGAIMTNVARRAQTESSLQSQVSRISAYLRFRSHFRLFSSIGAEPAIGLVLPWRSSADGTVRTFTSRLELPFTIGGQSSRFRLGTGLELNTIFPQGGSVELNNGVSTSTFYIPGRTTGSLLFLVHTGGVIGFSKSLAMTIDIYITGIASSERRRFHSALGLAWVL